MIKKERKIPLKIEKLEALLRRLPVGHAKRNRVEDELSKSLAGFKGEQSLDYFLSFLPEKETQIFHDLRLKENGRFFQMDCLIVTSSFLLILEIKNIAGTLFFDPLFQQMIRTQNGVDEALPDPLLQLRRQQWQLERWLKDHNITAVPIEGFVVFTIPYTILKTEANSSIHQTVIRSSSLPEKFSSLKTFYKNEIFSKKDLQKLSKLLIKQNSPYNPDILELFSVSKSELLTGVHCPNCNLLPLERRRGWWCCSCCALKSKSVVYLALKDYALLINTKIQNKEVRNFLHLSSEMMASRLLSTKELPHIGQNKGRIYDLSSLI